MTYTSYIIHDLGALGVTQKIQVMGSLQVNNLFIINLWTKIIYLRL